MVIIRNHQIQFQVGKEWIVLSCDDIDFRTIPEPIINLAVAGSISWSFASIFKSNGVRIQLPPIPKKAYDYIRNEVIWRKKTNPNIGRMKVVPNGETVIQPWKTKDLYLLPFTSGKESWLQYGLLRELKKDFILFYCIDPSETRCGPIREQYFDELPERKYKFYTNKRLPRLQYFGIPLLLSYVTNSKSVLIGSDAGHHTLIDGCMRYYGLTPLWQAVTNQLMRSLKIDFEYSSLVNCLSAGGGFKILCERYGDDWKKLHSVSLPDVKPGRLDNGTYKDPKFNRIFSMLWSFNKDPEEIGFETHYFIKLFNNNPEWIIEKGQGNYKDDIGTFLNTAIGEDVFYSEGWGDKILLPKLGYLPDELQDGLSKIFFEHLEGTFEFPDELKDENHFQNFKRLTKGFFKDGEIE